jgi:hypothetical protein
MVRKGMLDALATNWPQPRSHPASESLIFWDGKPRLNLEC